MKIVFATNNKHKLSEIRDILGNEIEVLSLDEIDCHADIPETSDTLEGNALQKAHYVYDNYHISCFADDTGLEVDALGGEPGIYSARYAGGEGHDSEANMRLLLHKLDGKENRKAHFSTFITYIEKKDAYTTYMKYFEGRIDGTILKEKHGTEGFGYDPIFQPDGYDKSFAELGESIKNSISHRACAIKELAEYIKNRQK